MKWDLTCMIGDMKKMIIEDSLTHKIIGCAMNAHNTLGNGFQEVIYQRAFEIELSDTDIGCQREFEIPIHYKGREIGTRRVDFSVEIGLLINLGGTKLEFKRLFA